MACLVGRGLLHLCLRDGPESFPARPQCCDGIRRTDPLRVGNGRIDGSDRRQLALKRIPHPGHQSGVQRVAVTRLYLDADPVPQVFRPEGANLAPNSLLVNPRSCGRSCERPRDHFSTASARRHFSKGMLRHSVACRVVIARLSAVVRTPSDPRPGFSDGHLPPRAFLAFPERGAKM